MHIAADVVIVGFTAAGACAAIEAAGSGSSVLDRFGGGGATALSGGVVYAGGGTRRQATAGVRRFCRDSAGMLVWLEEQGVPFGASLCPFKTSYPTDDYYLYYSGGELVRRDVALPAPRGHRTKGKAHRARCSSRGSRNPSAGRASACSPRRTRANSSPKTVG